MLNNNSMSLQERHEMLCDLVDVVEDWLDSKGFTPSDFPNDDRENDPDEAIVFGSDYDTLADGFSRALGIDAGETYKKVRISADSIDAFVFKVTEHLLQYGIDQAHMDIAPLTWYIGTNRASLDFLRALLQSKPEVIADKLHKGGSYDAAIKRLKRHLKMKEI